MLIKLKIVFEANGVEEDYIITNLRTDFVFNARGVVDKKDYKFIGGVGDYKNIKLIKMVHWVK